MSIAIRYYSMTGNTKKLAEAISEETGVNAETVDVPLEEKVDMLFLGSAVYAAGVDESVKKFIRENKEKIGKIVNFSTAALLPSTYKQVKKLADAEGIPMADEEFHCRGAFSVMHKGRPNEKDLADAKVFVKKFVKD